MRSPSSDVDSTGAAKPAGTTPVSGGEILTRSSTGTDLVQWLDAGGVLWTANPSPVLLGEDLSLTIPIRVGPQYPQRRNRHGWYFWPNRGHLWFESAVEMECLTELDQSGQIASIGSQPMRLLFGHSESCLSHVPDFMAVHNDGTQVLYDVKPKSRMTPSVLAQFELTARVCAAVGWRHVVLHGPSQTRHDNLAVLSGYRHVRCHPDRERFARIIDLLTTGRELGEARTMLDLRNPALATPGLAHLLWHRHLDFDWETPLDLDTVVTTTARGDVCCGQE